MYVNGFGFAEVAGVKKDKSGKLRELMSTEDVIYSPTATQVPTDCKQTQISRKGHCDMDSDKVSSVACCAVGATTLVLQNSGVDKSIKWNLPDKETKINVRGMKLTDVTKTRKKIRINFKSRVPKTKVSIIPIETPNVEDFLPLPSVPTKKKVS